MQLLEEIRTERPRGLRPVPRAAAGAAQAGHHRYQVVERVAATHGALRWAREALDRRLLALGFQPLLEGRLALLLQELLANLSLHLREGSLARGFVLLHENKVVAELRLHRRADLAGLQAEGDLLKLGHQRPFGHEPQIPAVALAARIL